MLATVWIGLAGALLMFAGDMLLYYTPEDFTYDVLKLRQCIHVRRPACHAAGSGAL